MSDDFKILEEPHKDYRLLYVSGRLDADTYLRLDKVLARCLSKKQANILIDFSKLAYISSIGIGILMKFANFVKAKGGQMILAGLDSEMRYVFEKLGLHKKFVLTRNSKRVLASLRIDK